MKKFFKQIVMSSTYRQAAIATPAKLEKDPDNRLLSRGPRFRMDAEMVRDYALAASGLLVSKHRRPEREALSAGRRLGSGSDDRSATRSDYQSRHRREALSPQHVYLLEAGRPAGIDGHLQRPLARELHGTPRAYEYAAAGSCDDERHPVRRSRAAFGRNGVAGCAKLGCAGSTTSQHERSRGRST